METSGIRCRENASSRLSHLIVISRAGMPGIQYAAASQDQTALLHDENCVISGDSL
jgi:hypothetical protein